MKQRISNKIFKKETAIHCAIFAAIICLFQSCEQKKQSVQFSNKDINQVITKMTEIMVHDVTNPPLAARFFSYACLSGYEVVSENDSSIKNMHGILNNYPQIKKPQTKNYDYKLSALLAMMERSEEHTSELQSRRDLVCRLLLEKKKRKKIK